MAKGRIKTKCLFYAQLEEWGHVLVGNLVYQNLICLLP